MRDYAKKIKSSKSTKSRAAYKLKKTGRLHVSLRSIALIAGFLILILLLILQILKVDIKEIVFEPLEVNINYSYPIQLQEDSVTLPEFTALKDNCNYLLQVEAYGREVYAQEELSKIMNFGLNAYIELFYSTNDPNKPLYRILSGPFENKSLVNNARDMLIKNGRKPLIIKKCSQT